MSSVLATQNVEAGISRHAARTGVLVVSTNQELRKETLSRLLSRRWAVEEAASGAGALEKIDAGDISLVLLDPALPDLRVEEFREIVQAHYPAIEIVPINPHTGQPLAAAHAADSEYSALVQEIERGGPYRAEAGIVGTTQDDHLSECGLPGFVGSTPAVKRIGSVVRLVAPRDTTVLITGESGTGKDLVAQAVHHLSLRRLKPFVVINCAAIPEPLLEAELFGFVKGAFTGAVQSRIGRIHAAQGGTLFLDEIGRPAARITV